MPLIAFGKEFMSADSNKFPRIKLQKDEKARIVCIEPQPTFGYAHNFQAPKFDGKGNAVQKLVTSKDGSEYSVNDLEFIGNYKCQGDPDEVAENGFATGCPACMASRENGHILGPVRRFAMNVVQYATAPGSSNVQEPLSVKIVVWPFTDKIYNKLVEIIDEIAERGDDLRKRDLKLECTNSTFQNYEITPADIGYWLKRPELTQVVKDTYINNKCEDLLAFCGKQVTEGVMKEAVNKTILRYNMLEGIVEAPTAVSNPQDMTQTSVTAMSNPDMVVSEPLNLEDLFSDL